MKNLILGGVRSGKSRYAETLARDFFRDREGCEKITLVATATVLDNAMADRVKKHQDERPSHWLTKEEPLYLAKTLDSLESADDTSLVIIDCLTLWLTNLLMKDDLAFLTAQVTDFVRVVSQYSKPLILVSNETNMGISPLGELTRRYCDEAGILHQRLAQACDSVVLVVAGLPLNLKSEK